jgi:UDP-N-acetylmuramoyl-L-alanyl-D-glutamate--2,6-diaminopimelate ligase
MRLRQLLAELELAPPPADPEITGLAYDSRQVKPGYAFIAIPGSHTDGHQYVGEAVQRGAVAVVVERPVVAHPAAVVQVASSRRALAELAAAFYRHPSRDLTLIGVTGTDGKTTTTILLHRILQEAGIRAAALNTVDVRVGEEVRPNVSRQTTPESLEIQAELRALADGGFQTAVLETSSHALALDRVTGCEFDVGVLTNLSHEHLDFHRTQEAYREAKGRLFEMLGAGGAKAMPRCAVLNRDDPEFDYFRRLTRVPLLTFGEMLPADLQAGDVEETVEGVRFTLRTPAVTFPVRLQLAGRWNVLNSLAASGAALAVGVPPETIRRGLEGVARVPGRMERVDLGQPFAVLIDYAHTPQSLEKVLRALRPVTRGRLGAVFGSAGERDRDKRPWMGEIAARLADYAIITDEDPREEDPQAILAEIAAGALACGKREGTDFVRIAGRAAAIAHAVAWARPGDTLLLAGKGHEGSIIVGRRAVPYDERATVETALRDQGVVPEAST